MTPDQDFTDEEIRQRRDAAIRRALNTPPQPRPAPKAGKAKPARSSVSKPGKRGPTDGAS